MAVSFSVAGKDVLVIGASSGIGYVVAREFAAAGANLTILAEIPEIAQAADRISAETGCEVKAALCDITDRQAVLELSQNVGNVDVLINNAAICSETHVTDVSDDTAAAFRRTMDVNVAGLYWMTQAIVTGNMNEGRVIFTSSLWGRTAGPYFSAYVASKHAVIGLVRALATELGPKGITVNAVCPHAVSTEMNIRVMPKEMRDKLTSIMWLRPGLIPPEAIAGTFLFLASDAASEITGQAISVDRGAFLA